MVKKLIALIMVCMMSGPLFAADAPSGDAGGSGSTPAPTPRISLFSTSTDWQALTGLRYSEYRGKFIPSSGIVGRGLVLYYLDGFPCYGLGEGVRVWIGPNNKHDGELRIACLYAPTEINFTWRNATRDADQAVSTGILTCPVDSDGRELTIDLAHCEKGPDWDEYK
ncbi:MAG: hypothetical protein IAC69_02125 [Proteobacteria bacterium]|uniref:Uncharacterized protein n=1 Tax=Candidatus Enterousia avistercoris TaxID=2840788 RepID=A0A9D9GUQ8_9PROT|nr:hypothetical protein [Candidatus Enterousia avistercoris]